MYQGVNVSWVNSLMSKIFGPVEKIALLGILAGATLKYLGMQGGDEILMIMMSLLAMLYFLMAYQSVMIRREDEHSGPMPIFSLAIWSQTMLQRVSWVGVTITLIGILFCLLKLHGAKEQLMFGLSAVGVGCVFMIVAVATNSKYSPSYMKILVRAVPVGLAGLYMFMNTPPN